MRLDVAEGTGIDLDQNGTTALPAAVRPPSALLALESSYSATGGDNDARNYRVCRGTRLDIANLTCRLINRLTCKRGCYSHDADSDRSCSLKT